MQPWQYLPNPWRDALTERLQGERGASLDEIRFRVGRPAYLYGSGWQEVVPLPPVPSDELERIVAVLADHSLYARQDELRQGYLTLPGGHRVGIAGRAILRDGRVDTVRQVSGLNMRVARAIRGPGEDLLSRLGDAISPRSFLIAGAPRSGKTTLLRDLVRRYGDSGQRVVVVDERSEIAGFGGAGDTGFDVGLHTDVLDGWPKADGIRIAVRTLGPDVVAVDELGGHHDAQAIAQARYAGVRVVATIHAGGRLDLTRHQSIWPLIQDGVFDGVVFLSSRPGPGSLTDLWMGPDQ